MVNTKEYGWSDVTVVVAGRPVAGLTLLQSEYQALKSAANGNILNMSFDIVVAYGNPENGDPITTDILKGVELTEDQTEWKQGDKFQEKALPFIYIDQKSY